MTKDQTTVILAALFAIALIGLRNGTAREHGFIRGVLVLGALALLWFAANVDY